MRERESRSHNRPAEQGLLEQDGNPPRDGSHHGRSIGRTGVIRVEKACPGGDALAAHNANLDSHRAHEKHDALHAGPIEQVRVLRQPCPDQEGRAENKSVEREKNRDKQRSDHEWRLPRKSPAKEL